MLARGMPAQAADTWRQTGGGVSVRGSAQLPRAACASCPPVRPFGLHLPCHIQLSGRPWPPTWVDKLAIEVLWHLVLVRDGDAVYRRHDLTATGSAAVRGCHHSGRLYVGGCEQPAVC